MINKKLESLENIERSIIVERKNDSFLDLYEKMKALNSKREFEPHHRSPLTKTMTDVEGHLWKPSRQKSPMMRATKN